MREYMPTPDFYNEYISHHGIKGQKWGVRNGPPYPLKSGSTGKPSASKKQGSIQKKTLNPKNKVETNKATSIKDIPVAYNIDPKTIHQHISEKEVVDHYNKIQDISQELPKYAKDFETAYEKKLDEITKFYESEDSSWRDSDGLYTREIEKKFDFYDNQLREIRDDYYDKVKKLVKSKGLDPDKIYFGRSGGFNEESGTYMDYFDEDTGIQIYSRIDDTGKITDFDLDWWDWD